MPFKTKEQRNIYQRNYYINNPDKLADKRRKNIEYMRNKRRLNNGKSSIPIS